MQGDEMSVGNIPLTLIIVSASFAAGQANAQDVAASGAGSLEQVTVTGTRIVRDGYEAPTPVTVISVDEIQKAPQQHISDFVNRLPAFGGGMSTTSGGNEISGGRQSQNNLNLRSLESYRTLVLLDGHRIVSGDVNGSVNINDLPQSLIRSVDVVTGGASAAYGSDALAGVVNFVLDKDYTGFKTDFQGGITDHGDNESYKANVTFGTPFADSRGHFIASAEYAHNNGLFGSSANRDWGFDTAHIIPNPDYNGTNAQFLIRRQASQIRVTPGGIVNAGPLRGWAFREDGTPYQFQYGSLTTPQSQYTVGGDWRDSEVTATAQSLANKLERGNAFARVSFEINDNVTAFVNLIYSNSEGIARSKQDDQGAMTISANNPFIPADFAPLVAAAGVPSFVMGSYNRDLDYIYTDNRRNMFSYAAGLEGTFQAFGRDWNWEAFGQVGKATTHIDALVKNNRNFNLALNAVRDVNGNIVCAVNANADPADDAPGCVAWNPFGWGQNGAAAVAWSKGHSRLDQENKQTVGTLSLSGEPFNNWAGPVSVATGLEWRKEEVVGVPDALSLQSVFSAGNFKGIRGEYDVSEGYFETVVPLLKDLPMARSLEFNGAARYTHYSTSGDVTTWKAGLTYDMTDDLRFRFTRSRDIRAPNLGELYARGQGGQSIGVVNVLTGETLPTFLNNTIGNPELTPEKADTTGFGVVYRPSYLEGFTVAVDYYDIDVNDAILTVGTQETLDRCLQAQQQFYCDNISYGGPNGSIDFITSLPFNFANLHQRGLDIEASYIKPLDQIVSSWRGDLTLRALGTHVEFSERDDGYNPVQDFAGDNSDVGPLNWRWLFQAEYSLAAFTASWTGRFMSSGHYAPRYIQCTSDCPRSTATATTIDYNYIESRFYHDLSLSYELTVAGTESQLYLNVANVLDEQPPLIASANPSLMSTNPQLYDTIGRAYYGGVRFKF
jgi:outer membrane receptor protein involved in Fe transport